MRSMLVAAAMALALSACTQPNVQNVPDDYASMDRQSSQGSASPPSRFSYEPDALQMAPFVLRDLETGCEYVVTTLFQNDVEIEPRMELSAKGVVVQRCVSATRQTGYRWIGGDDAPALRISTFHDLQTGCDYVSGTLFQKGSALTPRMIRREDGTVAPLCRRLR